MSFLVAAYAALWLGVFAYVLRLAGRLRALEDEARQLARRAEAERPAHPLEPTAGSGPHAPRTSGTRS